MAAQLTLSAGQHTLAAPLQRRPAFKSQRPCTMLRNTATLAIRPALRSGQHRLVCSAHPVDGRSTQQQEVQFESLEQNTIDVVPTTAEIDLEVVGTPTPANSSQPKWWELGQRIVRGAITFALVAAMALAPFAGDALAARSGGRTGGSSFSAARSYSGGGSRSYAGSGGGMSRGYSSGGYSGGGYRSAPSVTVIPQTSFGWGLGGGYYGGYGGWGYGAPVVSTGGGGGGLFTLLVLGVMGYAAIQILPQLLGGGGGDDYGYGKMTVAKVQVGLTGTARGLQKELERIAKRADTSSSEGLHFVLQETVLALLRHPEYCVYGAATTKGVRGLDAAEERFNEASMTERGKFEEETLVNVSGRTRNTSNSGRFGSRSGPSGDELIVVTVLVAAEGDLKIPNISSQDQLRTTLNRLGGLRSDQVMAVEVLWTPQDDGDYFTRDDLYKDYPTLNTL